MAKKNSKYQPKNNYMSGAKKYYRDHPELTWREACRAYSKIWKKEAPKKKVQEANFLKRVKIYQEENNLSWKEALKVYAEEEKTKEAVTTEERQPAKIKDEHNVYEELKTYDKYLEQDRNLLMPNIDNSIVDYTKFNGTFTQQVKKLALMNQIFKNRGNVYKSENQLGLSDTTHVKFMDRDPYYARVFNSIWDIILDHIEERAIDIALQGDKQMIIFLLKTKGKYRGYVEKSEQEVNTTDNSINIEIVKPDVNQLHQKMNKIKDIDY